MVVCGRLHCRCGRRNDDNSQFQPPDLLSRERNC
jgi:hypothetical protein